MENFATNSVTVATATSQAVNVDSKKKTDLLANEKNVVFLPEVEIDYTSNEEVFGVPREIITQYKQIENKLTQIKNQLKNPIQRYFNPGLIFAGMFLTVQLNMIKQQYPNVEFASYMDGPFDISNIKHYSENSSVIDKSESFIC